MGELREGLDRDRAHVEAVAGLDEALQAVGAVVGAQRLRDVAEGDPALHVDVVARIRHAAPQADAGHAAAAVDAHVLALDVAARVAGGHAHVVAAAAGERAHRPATGEGVVDAEQHAAALRLDVRAVAVGKDLAAGGQALRPDRGAALGVLARRGLHQPAIQRGVAHVAAALDQYVAQARMGFARERIERALRLCREQLGQRQQQRRRAGHRIRRTGHRRLVARARRRRQRHAAAHVQCDQAGAVAQVEAQEGRVRAAIEQRELAVHAVRRAEQRVRLPEQEEVRRARQAHGAALQRGGAGHGDAVGCAVRAELGVEERARRLRVAAGDVERADAIARRDGAPHGQAVDGAGAAQAPAGVDPRVRAGVQAVDEGRAAVDGHVAAGERAVEHEETAVHAHVAGQRVVAVELEHAAAHGGAVERVVARQAQPAGAGLGQPAGAADVVGPVVPGQALPDLRAAGAGVHHHVGVHAQQARAFDGALQVDQAPAVDVVHARRAEVVGGGEQHVAHLRVGQVRETLHQQRQRAGDVRGRHRGAGHVADAVFRVLVGDFNADEVAVGVAQHAAAGAAADHRRGDVGARRGDAPVAAQAADAGAGIQPAVPAQVHHAQPVLLQPRHPARQGGVDAGDLAVVVAGGEDLQRAVLQRGIGVGGEVVGHAVQRIELVHLRGGGGLHAQAPAVVDDARALRGHLLVHARDRGGIRADGMGLATEADHREQVGIAVGEQAGAGEVGAEGHAMRALAVAVGDHRAGHVRAMRAELEAGDGLEIVRHPVVEVADVHEVLHQRAVLVGVFEVVQRDGVAVGREARALTGERAAVGAGTAVAQQVRDADAAVLAAGELAMAQVDAAVEDAHADAAPGQPARIGVFGIDQRQAPVAVELVGAPAVGIADAALLGIALRNGSGRERAQQQGAGDGAGEARARESRAQGARGRGVHRNPHSESPARVPQWRRCRPQASSPRDWLYTGAARRLSSRCGSTQSVTGCADRESRNRQVAGRREQLRYRTSVERTINKLQRISRVLNQQ